VAVELIVIFPEVVVVRLLEEPMLIAWAMIFMAALALEIAALFANVSVLLAVIVPLAVE